MTILASDEFLPSGSRSVDALLRWAVRDEVCWTPAAVLPVLRHPLSSVLGEALSHHRMWGLVHAAVVSHLVRGGSAHPQLVAELGAMRTEAVAWHLRVLADLRALGTVLEPLGVPWAVFKGPVLAELAYGGEGLRSYADLDVLVDQAAFGDVVDALEAAGIEVWDRNWSLQLELDRAELSCVLPHGTMLDLHWHPVNDAPARREFSVDPATLLARRRQVVLGVAGTVPILDPADHLVVVALHATLSGGHQLQWTKDVAQLVRGNAVDVPTVTERAHQMGAAVAVAWMLARAERLTGPLATDLTVDDLVGDGFVRQLVLAGERAVGPRRFDTNHGSGRLVTSSLRDQPGLWRHAVARGVRTHPFGWRRWRSAVLRSATSDELDERALGRLADAPEECYRMRRAEGGAAARQAYLQWVSHPSDARGSGRVL